MSPAIMTPASRVSDPSLYLLRCGLSRGWQQKRCIDGTAAAKAEGIVRMTARIQDPCAMPERRPPAAPVLVRPICVEDEPRPFHLRIPQSRAPTAGHPLGRQGQIHVLQKHPAAHQPTRRLTANLRGESDKKSPDHPGMPGS